MTRTMTKTKKQQKQKTKLEEVKEAYSHAPAKPEQASVFAMKIRYETVLNGINTHLLETTPTRLDDNVSDKALKAAPLDTLEGMANLLLFNGEYLERAIKYEEIRTRPRDEWKRLERQYVERASYTLYDLYDDLRNRCDTVEEYRKERRKYKRCKNRFCENVFQGRKNKRYCCDQCKKSVENQKTRFIETARKYVAGTYLPEDEYEINLDRYEEEQYRKNESVFEAEMIDVLRTGITEEETEYSKGKDSRDTRRKRGEAVKDYHDTKEQLKQVELASGRVVSYNLYDLSTEDLQKHGLAKYKK